jgi:NDP-sugar pyrophosphorylase family protein
VHRDVFKDVDNSPVFWSKQSDKLSWKFNPADALRETFSKSNYDTVSKPKHYMLFEEEGIEVRDVIEKLVGRLNGKPIPNYRFSPLFVADYVQMLQYVMRFMDKNGSEDLKKARWYLDKMIEAYE